MWELWMRELPVDTRCARDLFQEEHGGCLKEWSSRQGWISDRITSVSEDGRWNFVQQLKCCFTPSVLVKLFTLSYVSYVSTHECANNFSAHFVWTESTEICFRRQSPRNRDLLRLRKYSADLYRLSSEGLCLELLDVSSPYVLCVLPLAIALLFTFPIFLVKLLCPIIKILVILRATRFEQVVNIPKRRLLSTTVQSSSLK